MPSACLALKLGLMALFIAFAMKLLRESIAARTLALYASPFILFVVCAVPSNPLNLPVTGALAAFAIVLSAKNGG
jgi:predicted Co/Zn/Cd cation transporter (cation efflux family)